MGGTQLSSSQTRMLQTHLGYLRNELEQSRVSTEPDLSKHRVDKHESFKHWIWNGRPCSQVGDTLHSVLGLCAEILSFTISVSSLSWHTIPLFFPLSSQRSEISCQSWAHSGHSDFDQSTDALTTVQQQPSDYILWWSLSLKCLVTVS